MKATELMIGDWVFSIKYDAPFQIEEIRTGIVTTWSFNVVAMTYDEILPISLTAEILEKNGFKEYNGYGYASNKGYCLKEFYINNNFTIKTANIDCKINFVHELQHALKLCGIDKNIEL